MLHMTFTYQPITVIQHQLLKTQKLKHSSVFTILGRKYYIKIHQGKRIFLLESFIPRLLFQYAFICINPVGAAEAARYLGRCTQSDSSGSSPVGGSSPFLQHLSSSAAPVVSPPFPGLWLLSASPSPPSSPWLPVCPPLSLPLIGVFVWDSSWQVPQIEMSSVHLEPKTMGGGYALCSALNLRRCFRSRSSHLSLRLTAFQCRFRRIQRCPMCWWCAVLTFPRLPVSIKLTTSTTST